MKRVDSRLVTVMFIALIIFTYWLFEDDIGIDKWVDMIVKTSSLVGLSYTIYNYGEDSRNKQKESFRQFARDRYRCLKAMRSDVSLVRSDVSEIFPYGRSGSPQDNSKESSLLKRCEDLFRRIEQQVEEDMESWNDYASKEIGDLHQELVEYNRRLRESVVRNTNQLQ